MLGYLQKLRQSNTQALDGMRRAGRLAAEVLDMITDHVAVGVSTAALDQICHEAMTARGATPAPLGYKGYPKATCISVNHVVCHGIPSQEKVLAEGDILNIDVTVIKDGWHGDSSRMYYVGQPRKHALRLIQTTHDAMMAGINVIAPGVALGDLGYAIQSFAEGHGFSVVRNYCGHGIGQSFHMWPNVLHYGERGTREKLRAGMFITVEPMINAGNPEVKTLLDGWTVVTRDRKLSAQFEHTVAVTDDGFEILTQSPRGYHAPPYVDS